MEGLIHPLTVREARHLWIWCAILGRKWEDGPVDFSALDGGEFGKISPGAKRLWGLCMWQALRAADRGQVGTEGLPYFKLTAKQAGELLGMSGSSQQACFRELKSHGLMTWERSKRGGVNRYIGLPIKAGERIKSI